jgi:hypothetical protein
MKTINTKNGSVRTVLTSGLDTFSTNEATSEMRFVAAGGSEPENALHSQL